MAKTPSADQPSLFSNPSDAPAGNPFDMDAFARHIGEHAPQHPYAEQIRRKLGKVMTKDEVEAVIASESRGASMAGSGESPIPRHSDVPQAAPQQVEKVSAEAPLWQRTVMVDPADAADWARKQAEFAAENAAGTVPPTGDDFTQEHFARVNQQVIHPDNR